MTQAAPTLPEQLLLQARTHGQAIALRHKQLGIWQARQWRDIADETGRLAAALAERGFVAGETLLLLTHPRPEALLLALAAQWLGGVAAALDPATPADELTTLRAQLPARFLFVEDEQQVALALASGGLGAVSIYTQGRGLSAHDGLHAYTTLAAGSQQHAVPAPQARPEQAAFAFYRLDAAGKAERQLTSHAELLQEGRRLIVAEALTASEEALAARAFATGAHARYLLAPWLLAGFRLNFPENLATRDNDRRELGPTLVAGTRETWGRLAAQLQQRLPGSGHWRRRWIDHALQQSGNGPLRWLHQWLIVRPLRDVLGLTRTRVPLLVGEDLPPATAELFAALGVPVRNWPDPAQWHDISADAEPSVTLSGWLAPATPALQAG